MKDLEEFNYREDREEEEGGREEVRKEGNITKVRG